MYLNQYPGMSGQAFSQQPQVIYNAQPQNYQAPNVFYSPMRTRLSPTYSSPVSTKHLQNIQQANSSNNINQMPGSQMTIPKIQGSTNQYDHIKPEMMGSRTSNSLMMSPVGSRHNFQMSSPARNITKGNSGPSYPVYSSPVRNNPQYANPYNSLLASPIKYNNNTSNSNNNIPVPQNTIFQNNMPSNKVSYGFNGIGNIQNFQNVVSPRLSPFTMIGQTNYADGMLSPTVHYPKAKHENSYPTADCNMVSFGGVVPIMPFVPAPNNFYPEPMIPLEVPKKKKKSKKSSSNVKQGREPANKDEINMEGNCENYLCDIYEENHIYDLASYTENGSQRISHPSKQNELSANMFEYNSNLSSSYLHAELLGAKRGESFEPGNQVSAILKNDSSTEYIKENNIEQNSGIQKGGKKDIDDLVLKCLKRTANVLDSLKNKPYHEEKLETSQEYKNVYTNAYKHYFKENKLDLSKGTIQNPNQSATVNKSNLFSESFTNSTKKNPLEQTQTNTSHLSNKQNNSNYTPQIKYDQQNSYSMEESQGPNDGLKKVQDCKSRIDELFSRAMQRSENIISRHNVNTRMGNAAGNKEPLLNFSSNTNMNTQAANPLQFDDGTRKGFIRYEGDINGHLRNGRGICEYGTGDIYQGSWIKDTRYGFGKLSDRNNRTIYSGEWVEDQYEGQGCLYNLSIDKNPLDYRFMDNIGLKWVQYEGDFKKGLPSGKGILFLSNGDKFSGMFERGILHGEGSYNIKATGDTILGRWENGRFTKCL